MMIGKMKAQQKQESVCLTKVSKQMRLSKLKEIVLLTLIVLIGVIILLSIIYQRTALWEPEQHFITLLPKSPVCYLTLKELKGLVQTFNHSELGKQSTKMPILAEIEQQQWWKQLVYQKQLWEYEMGGKLDLKTITGYFGEEAILAIYQREGEYTFLLITKVGGPEKLSIEAITATDAINPKYERIQTEYRQFTINTIVGYPRNFSYTFIGKIGVLTLDPLLLAETIDLYADASEQKAAQSSQRFTTEHPMGDKIQQDYRQDKNTGYVDVQQLASALDSVDSYALVKQIYGLFGDMEFWTFSNRYEDGVIVSQHRLRKQTRTLGPAFPAADDTKPFDAFPERTAFVTSLPVPGLTTALLDGVDLSPILGTDLTLLFVAPESNEVTVVPSLVLLAHAKAPDALKAILEIVKQGGISLAGKPLEFLEIQDYKGITIQPIQLRLNFLLAVTGGYAIVDDYFVLSTTLMGLKSVIDTMTGNAPISTDISFSADVRDAQAFVQPELFVPELKRLLPLATVLLSLSGQQLDATLTQRITENLFPLASLGPITAEMDLREDGMNAEIRIILEK